MSKGKDWVPRQEEKVAGLMAVWQKKLADVGEQSACGWPADECAAVAAAVAAFVGARTAYQAAPTKANHTEKEERKTAAVAEMRKFARERIRNNSKMHDSQKLELGIAPPDRELTPIPVPDAGPQSEADISAREPGVVKVRYLGAKPYGVDRIEIAWSLSDDLIDSPDRLANHETFSRNPWERAFPGSDRARKLYYSLRYLARDGESHWSDVREIIIP